MSEEEKPEVIEERAFTFEVPSIGVDPARVGRFFESAMTLLAEDRVFTTKMCVTKSSVSFVCSLSEYGRRLRAHEIAEYEPEKIELLWSTLHARVGSVVELAVSESRFASEVPMPVGPYLMVTVFEPGSWVSRRRPIPVSRETYERHAALTTEHGTLDIFTRGPIDRLRRTFSLSISTVSYDGHFLAAAVERSIPTQQTSFVERVSEGLEELLAKPLIRVREGSEIVP